MHLELLIAGHKIGGPCDQAIGKELIRNPWNGSVVGTVAEGGWSELLTAISAAQDAFETKSLQKIDRKALLNRIADLIIERQDELAELAVLEIGKPISMARAEVQRTARTFRLAAEEVDRLAPTESDLGYDPRGQGLKATVCRAPLGVIFAITPYNWPYNLAAHKIAPALASGNPVVLKPHPLAAGCSLALAHIIHEAGCPDGAFNCWNGPTPLVAKALRDPRVKMISFTGSQAVGWKLKQEYWRTPIVLELGANAPVFVCESADLDDAVEKLVVSAYGYAGQVCISAQNAFVESSIYNEFRDRLIQRISALECADPQIETTLCGPMIHEEAAIKVEKLAENLNILAGGHRERNRLSPILVEELSTSHPLMNEEAFGPILTLSRMSKSEMKNRLANTESGINASLFTQEKSDLELIEDSTYPTININQPPSLRFDSLPYGGQGTSGWGSEGIESSILEMTTPQVMVQPYLEP